MLAKTWKTILLAICIIAVLFNIISKIVRTPSFQKNLDKVIDKAKSTNKEGKNVKLLLGGIIALLVILIFSTILHFWQKMLDSILFMLYHGSKLVRFTGVPLMLSGVWRLDKNKQRIKTTQCAPRVGA